MFEAINPATGQPIFGEIVQQFMLAAFGILSLLISALLTWLFAKLSTVLPAWLVARTEKDNALIDEKLKRDTHDAAITVVREIILNNQDPRQALSEAIEKMMESAKDATNRWMSQGRTLRDVKDIYGRILVSKIPLVITELNYAKSSTGQSLPQEVVDQIVAAQRQPRPEEPPLPADPSQA